MSRVESFYLHARNEVALIPAFVAMVRADAQVRPGPEHDHFEWLGIADATQRLAWPRERRALEDAAILLEGGSAGPLEDVLRIC